MFTRIFDLPVLPLRGRWQGEALTEGCPRERLHPSVSLAGFHLPFQGRIWLPLLLSACSQDPTPPPPGERIVCALDGAAEFAQTCTLERSGPQLVVHRPDGGFR